MRGAITESVVAADAVAAFLQPRDDTVLERSLGDGRFDLVEGPFDRYRREVTCAPGDDGCVRVTQRIDYRPAMPLFGRILGPLVRRDLTRVNRYATSWPWWLPRERMTARSANVLSLLCGLAVIAGYASAVTSQAMTFAAEDFGVSDVAQGNALAAIRIGVVVSLVLMTVADRRGRRPVLLGTVAVAGIATLAGAVAPDIYSFTGSQMVTRGAATTGAVLLGVVAAEEVGARSRAYAVSLLATCGGVGLMLAVVLLPLADIAPWGWRLLYLVPIVFVPLFRVVWRELPESHRFERSAASVRRVETDPRPSARRSYGRRLALFAVSSFAFSLFATPTNQLLNDFLRDERGFAGAGVSLFRVATSLPGAIGIVVGGRLAEVHGRRRVGAVAVFLGSLSTMTMFLTSGAPMWLLGTGGTLFVAAGVPALGVYGPEMFPTSSRGRANAIITVFGVVGSALGLVLAGRLRDDLGDLGHAFTYLFAAPVLVVGLVLAFYPETASLELEEINPEDEPDRKGR